jgi:hypothetical protein
MGNLAPFQLLGLGFPTKARYQRQNHRHNENILGDWYNVLTRRQERSGDGSEKRATERKALFSLYDAD